MTQPLSDRPEVGTPKTSKMTYVKRTVKIVLAALMCFVTGWWGAAMLGRITGSELVASFIHVLFIGLFCMFAYAICNPDVRTGGFGKLIRIIYRMAVGLFLLVFGLMVLFFAGGGAWGRPLRIKGRQVHPDLREGSDWTRGAQPDPMGLDEATRAALEALWLHDAQKEHASVPAFSRISWMLAAVGAPADLMEWSHRAALEEIEHTRLCFALAAGYAGRSFTVEAMPDLLLGGLDVKGDPLVIMAQESLADGCQLEDYNADVAAACAVACEEPVTRAVLEQIAREERSHADFSWALLEWLLERSPQKVRPVIEKSGADLVKYKRPTAVSWDKKRLVDQANPELMLKHGRLPDARWKAIWEMRLAKTQERVAALLSSEAAEIKQAA